MMCTKKLPAPRLQLRWAASDLRAGCEWECHYELVIPLAKYDIRTEQEDSDGNPLPSLTELAIPMNGTSVRGSSSTPCTARDGTRYYDPPYRDGAHAIWDAKLLGDLPVFVIAPDGMAFARPVKDAALSGEQRDGGEGV